jgi:hypothetical protein
VTPSLGFQHQNEGRVRVDGHGIDGIHDKGQRERLIGQNRVTHGWGRDAAPSTTRTPPAER